MIKLFLSEKYSCPASFGGCEGIGCVDLEVSVISTLPAPILQIGKELLPAHFICRLISLLSMRTKVWFADIGRESVTVHCCFYIFLTFYLFYFSWSFMVLPLCPNRKMITWLICFIHKKCVSSHGDC